MPTKTIKVSGFQDDIKVKINIICYFPWSFTYSSINQISYEGSNFSNPTNPDPQFIGKSTDLINLYNNFGAIFTKNDANKKLKYKIIIEWYKAPLQSQLSFLDNFEIEYDEENPNLSNIQNPLNPNFTFKFN
jgi:hypothetical protein